MKVLYFVGALLFVSGCAIGNQSTNQHYDIATTYLKVKHTEIKDKKSLSIEQNFVLSPFTNRQKRVHKFISL